MSDDEVLAIPNVLDGLAILQSNEKAAADALEQFISQQLTLSGAWRSVRESDGVATYRVVERTDERARIKGRIWLIADQSQPIFLLDIEATERVAWTLYFDLVSFGRGRERDVRDAFDLIESPQQATWRVKIVGSAMDEHGKFIL